MASSNIPGYTLGSAATSPISLEDFELLKKTVLFGDADVEALRMSRDVLADQTEAVLDVWYGFVGSHPHLLKYFASLRTQAPLGDYLTAVRKRFGQWILDTAAANYDQAWLNYQHEIGLRHEQKKNATDGAAAAGAPSVVNYRYIVAFIYPITATLRPFLAKKGASEADVDRMQQAWIKSVILTVILVRTHSQMLLRPRLLLTNFFFSFEHSGLALTSRKVFSKPERTALLN
jgi:hypothetical protein